MTSPRDRFLTVYGRRPVLEALARRDLRVAKVLVSTAAQGPEVAEIERAAAVRGVEIRRVPPTEVTRVSRNGRHDQGVAADVEAASMRGLDEWLAVGPPDPATVVVLDGVTNPQNVGMILRTATAAGADGVVVPTAGVADLGPLVVKASAGVAFRAPILRARTGAGAVDALRSHGFRVYGLDPDARRSLYEQRPFADRSAFVLGGEHDGVRVEVDEVIGVPMAGGVESLNVAVAAGVVCFELLRRRL
ncbi:MAG TPA: RNA methyltransferase [Acidimicrobiales bacterium]|nr:RNA methyltransferase [Acidimicrobiales bacterium]